MASCNDEQRECMAKIMDFGFLGVGAVFTDDGQMPMDEQEKQRPPEEPFAVPPDGGE